MPICTKTGDAGQTGLLGGARVPKDHPRIEACGEVDELNCALGAALAAGLHPETAEPARHLQNRLFILGAALADASEQAAPKKRITEEDISWLENLAVTLEKALPPFRHFILPGGTAGAAALHLARAICRRAERRAWVAVREAGVPAETARFLNRLSDALFLLARKENHLAGAAEPAWEKPSPPT